MLVERLSLRAFRSYAAAEVALGPGLTVISGANGAGKTNLLEALYFGCTGRSCRTTNEREVVHFGERVARVELRGRTVDGAHVLSVGFEPGQPKRLTADGVNLASMADAPARPLAAVFLPDRLELVKGAPGLRRAHLDQVVAALWPARAATRKAYAGALAQRNALLGRVRAGASSRAALPTWDAELARHGLALMEDRARTVEGLRDRFAAHAEELGLDGEPALSYKPRSRAASAEELAAELAERIDRDLERGFTSHGPHRDDLGLQRGGRDLRAYGSQGQQRLGLLALLLAERAAIAELRAAPPLLLLDDVMSELDRDRRERLVAHLRTAGQSVVTTTDLEHVPGAGAADVARVSVSDGVVLQEALAA